MKVLTPLAVLTALSLCAAPNNGLKPVWEDDFNAKEIDAKKWNVRGGARIVDGKLQIELSSTGKPGFWTDSGVNSSKKFTHPQGYFEASIRAIQSKNRGWVYFGIRNEDMSKNPSAGMRFSFSGADKISPDLDIVDESGSHHLAPKENVIPMDGGKSYKKFLTYGLQWTDKNYIWYVEGRQVHKMARPIPGAPMFIEFNHWLPEGGLLKDFMNPKLGPEPLQVDWVKVFKIP
jgi:beta-glucanase (GH16 family)